MILRILKIKRLLNIVYSVGGDQPGDPTDLPDLHDGSTLHHGPAAAGRGQHGGEGDQGHHLPQELQAHRPGVRLPQSGRHAHRRR